MKQLDIINVHIGKRLKELRKKNKINQETLAKGMGLTRTSVCNIEAGKQGLTPLNLYLACSIIGCTPNDLFPEMKEVEIKFDRVVEVVEREKYIPNVVFK